jgi:hypothetical protein
MQRAKTLVQFWSAVGSLVGLLAYTFVHTGGLLSRYVSPGWVGYLAGLCIELAVIGLALRIGDLRQSGQSAGFFGFVLAGTLVVSALANMAEGFRTLSGQEFTARSLVAMDWSQAVIGTAATGLISLIVFALSEMVGVDVQHMRGPDAHPGQDAHVTVSRWTCDEQVPRDSTDTAGRLTLETSSSRATWTPPGRDADRETVRAALLAYTAAHPGATHQQIGDAIGRGRTTVYKLLREMNAGGHDGLH